MKSLQAIALAMRFCHDGIIQVVQTLGFEVNDKALHFIVVGIIGLILFSVGDILCKHFGNRFASIASFVFSLIIVTLFAIAIEVIQGLTNSGNVEFADIAYGLAGFIFFFIVHVFIECMFNAAKRVLKEIEAVGIKGKYVRM